MGRDACWCASPRAQRVSPPMCLLALHDHAMVRARTRSPRKRSSRSPLFRRATSTSGSPVSSTPHRHARPPLRVKPQAADPFVFPQVLPPMQKRWSLLKHSLSSTPSESSELHDSSSPSSATRSEAVAIDRALSDATPLYAALKRFSQPSRPNLNATPVSTSKPPSKPTKPLTPQPATASGDAIVSTILFLRTAWLSN